MLFSKVKNFLIAFAIAFAVFGVVALIVVDLVIKSIGGAFTLGNLGSDGSAEAPGDQGTTISNSGGSSLYFLAVITDYRPSFYGDYDFAYIKETLGSLQSKGTPADVRPVSDSVFNLPLLPGEGTVDSSGGGVGIIGGLKPGNARTIHTDVTVLVRMDKERKQFTFTYFPKDAVVSYGGERVLFRDIYYNYGIEALINVVHSITGIRPDRHIVLHSEYVDDVIDRIGGIDLMLSVPMQLNDPENDIMLDLDAGANQLDGNTARQYLLYNNYATSDDFSIERAGLVMIRALISRLTQPAGYANAGSTFNVIRQYCVTDMLVSDIANNRDIWYAYAAYAKQQIDIRGRYITEDGQRVYNIDADRTLSVFLDYRKIYQ